MTDQQWAALSSFRERFRSQCDHWLAEAEGGCNEWAKLAAEAAAKDGVPPYPVDTPVVYNHSLDELTPESDIRLIVVGDNPGKNEQLAGNRRYLVGLAGKIGDRFFRLNPELGIDFRRNVLILNKTPLHSAKTKELDWIKERASPRLQTLLLESQEWMARETASLRASLDCPLWLVGYSELKKGGIFCAYAEELGSSCRRHTTGTPHPEQSVPVYCFQHFSMNRFTIDLAQRGDTTLPLAENLTRLGTLHRLEILGW